MRAIDASRIPTTVGRARRSRLTASEYCRGDGHHDDQHRDHDAQQRPRVINLVEHSLTALVRFVTATAGVLVRVHLHDSWVDPCPMSAARIGRGWSDHRHEEVMEMAHGCCRQDDVGWGRDERPLGYAGQCYLRGDHLAQVAVSLVVRSAPSNTARWWRAGESR